MQKLAVFPPWRMPPRPHRTDRPYRWHVNDGEEVFAVMAGEVAMRYRQDGVEKQVTLQAGDLC